MPILTSISGVHSTGVTTTALHLAHGMAIAGLRTLLIDLNPDCKASYLLSCVRNADQPSSSSLLKPDGAAEIGSAVLESVRPSLDVLPAGVDLERWIKALEESSFPDKDYLLVESLTRLNGSYQTVIIDAPAAPLSLKRSVLLNSAILIYPVSSRASLPGLADLGRLALSLEFSGSLIAILSRVRTDQASDLDLLRTAIHLDYEKLLYEAARANGAETSGLRTDVLKTAISFQATKNIYFSPEIPTAFDVATLKNTVGRNHRDAFSSIAKNYWSLVEELMELLVSSLGSGGCAELDEPDVDVDDALEAESLKNSISGR